MSKSATEQLAEALEATKQKQDEDEFEAIAVPDRELGTVYRRRPKKATASDAKKASVVQMPPRVQKTNAAARAGVTVAVEAVPAKTEPSVRRDMPEAVLDGRLGEIYQKRLGNFPIAYAWPALLTLGCASMPSEIEIGVSNPRSEHSPFRPTLYAAQVGPVGSGKSQAVEQAAKVLGVAKPVLLNLKAGSMEGLAPTLVASGQPRILFPDEWGHLLDKAAIQGASFSRVLNTLYYHDSETLIIAKGRSVEINCKLSIIGGVVEEDFGDVFGASTAHGLYSRMIFGLCPEPWQYLYRPFEGSAEPLSPKSIAVHADVWAARDEWVKTHGIHTRDAENALRCAYIAAAFDGRDLKATDLGPALELAKYQSRFRQMFSPNVGLTYDAQAGNRLMDVIKTVTAEHRAAGATENPWINLRRLQNDTRLDRKYGSGICLKTVQNLVGAEYLELEVRGRSKFVRLLDPDF